ncbi:MAG: hypothetical protein WD904_12205 [Dehalococcoidia bacterium]
MAVLRIAHKPALTSDEAQEIFRRHFDGKYSVQPCNALLSLKTKYRDFQVVKNLATGVALKLQQSDSETSFVYAAVPPNRWVRSFSFGFAALICWLQAGSLTREVEDFIKAAPEFN